VVLSIALATFCCWASSGCARTCGTASRRRSAGTDLIVGARTGPVQLLLYAVFRIGGATNNIR
jgi:putative ABC transport system permease protein